MLFKAMGMNEITWGERPRKCLRSESTVPGEGWRLMIPQLNMAVPEEPWAWQWGWGDGEHSLDL